MTRILGLSGSLRRGSFNAGLLRAAAELAPADITIDIGSIRDVPLYDADAEKAEGIPPSVQALKASLLAADGLLLATPENNNSIPGE
jgi:NAD(P)H-dependent FMN reductase